MRATLTDHINRKKHILIADDREAGMKALDKIVKEARPNDVTKQEWQRQLAKGWDVQLIVE